MSSVYYNLSSGNFLQDWSNTGLITTNNDWSGVPSIVGFVGDDGTTTVVDRDPRLITADFTTPSLLSNQTGTTNTSGAVGEFQLTNPTIGLQGSGTADNPNIVIYLDATGRQNVTLSFNARDIDGSNTDNAVQQIAVQYRTSASGTWVNLPAGYIADATTGPNLATLVTGVTVLLPADANNVATLQVRILTSNAFGSDEWVGIDDISVVSEQLSAVSPGALSIDDVSVAETNGGTTDAVFTVTRTGGSDGAVSATWTVVQGGTATSDDFDPASLLSGTVDFAAGQTSATITVRIAGDTLFEADETYTVELTAPTGGATILDGLGLGTIVNNDAPPASPGDLRIGDVSLTEGNAGTAAMTFTVTRTAGSDGAVSAGWTIDLTGTADAADLGAGAALSGTVDFADGETSRTITVAIAGDTVVEGNETFTVSLSAPTGGATISDGSATGTILNDDVPPPANVFINEIHYDDAGADANEAIEVAGLAGTDLTGWRLVLYNGNGGVTYSPLITLSGVIADQANGFGTLSFAAPGIQNGAPDGVALVDNFGRVIQFLSYEGAFAATNGPAAGMFSTDIGVSEEPAPADGLSLQLTGSGTSAADFTWTSPSAASAGAVNAGQTFLSVTGTAHYRVGDAQVAEGDSGVQSLVFTVNRAGGIALAGAIDYAVALNGTADGADLAAGAVLSGTLVFAAGEVSKQVIVPIQGDTVGERNETLGITLSNAAGDAVIDDAAARGIIVNDDPIMLGIGAIQGEGHRSEYSGQSVITTGIITAIDTNGFYMQDAGDSNARTSDGIFVFTNTAPAVAVGDGVRVIGTVTEFQGGAGALTVTEIYSPTIIVESTGNALPAATLIGTGGLLPPTEVTDDDGLTSYDPLTDGIDFWESLEGMLVTIDRPQAVSNANSFGETDIVASLGAGATGMNDRGGITISAGDYNPEKIQLDFDSGVYHAVVPALTVGDQLASVTGVIDYAFNRYEVVATQAVTVTLDRALEEEVTSLRGDDNQLSIATYNLENLDPGDGKYEILAADIVYNLQAPDIIAVQEVQDGDGAGTGTDLSGTVTIAGLIAAIDAAGGPHYTYIEIAPSAPNTTGGEPNGNIRVGYLFDASRVTYVAGSLEQVPGTAFNNTRSPLAAQFTFNGETFTAINVHFTSRGGSDPLWGDTQPPADAGQGARTAQIAAVRTYVNAHLADDPSLNFMVLGDWNGFYFENEQLQLTADGTFTNLNTLLTPEERYSYLFDGNAQQIDNILVTGGLLDNARYDAVHLNSQALTVGRPTDHDPQVALLYFNAAPTALVLDDATIDENAGAGAAVGTLATTDSAGDTHGYVLVDDAGGRFAVNAVTGAITATASLNFEEAVSYQITARSTDQDGAAIERTFTITVGDVNEAPTAQGDAVAVNEDATTANLWALLLGNDSDPDADAVLSVTAVDTAGTLGSVVFDAATQTLRYVADNDAFDALAPGATQLDSFTYTVTDQGGLTSTATVTVTITGIADGITLTGGKASDTLTGTGGEDTLFGNQGDDTLQGLGGHDLLYGGQGSDGLYGGDGNDRLAGEQGNDFLFGGAGRDVLFGGQGSDVLNGGTGADVFHFGKQGGADIVSDYEIGIDRIVLDDGITLRSSRTADVNGDGQADLVLSFSGDVSATLLGVSSLGQVNIASGLAVSSLSVDYAGSHAAAELAWLAQVQIV